jgi:NAD(P)-dependent dehydrogenase (short-subunit alcohol dehydrogenase family)
MSVVVITGASRGIGAATARLAAERGHDVCVNFPANEAAAGAIVAEVLALGQRAVAVQADVARASKAALDALTIGLSKEVAGEGIRVNGVRAGIIDTGIHASGGEPGRVARLGPQLPMGRGGQATEVARAILWLLSDEASYTTGTFIDVAGGR